MIAISFKVVVVVTTALLGVCALRSPLMQRLSERAFISAVACLQLVPALAVFVAIYVIGHQNVTSDVPGYYVPAAQAVLNGQVPYRDFALSYAPLFPYIGASLLTVWDDAKVFALFAIAVNALALVLWHKAAVVTVGEHTARASSVLFATSGHVLVQALLGTNQAWIGAALAASTLFIVTGREVASGVAQAAALCAVKVLSLLFWPVLWIMAGRRMRWLAAAVLPCAIVYGAFAMSDADLLAPLRKEGDLISSGNLPYVLGLWIDEPGTYLPRLFDVLAVGMLGGAALLIYKYARAVPDAARAGLLIPALALLGLTFMFFSKKSFTGYILFFLYPTLLVLVLSVRDLRWCLALSAVFNLLLAVEPSVWFFLGGNGRPLDTWLDETPSLAVYAFVLLDLALIACYAYLGMLSGATLSRIASQSAKA